jgi:hypothetical protein
MRLWRNGWPRAIPCRQCLRACVQNGGGHSRPDILSPVKGSFDQLPIMLFQGPVVGSAVHSDVMRY